jgi:hypothetical protein
MQAAQITIRLLKRFHDDFFYSSLQFFFDKLLLILHLIVEILELVNFLIDLLPLEGDES